MKNELIDVALLHDEMLKNEIQKKSCVRLKKNNHDDYEDLILYSSYDDDEVPTNVNLGSK